MYRQIEIILIVTILALSGCKSALLEMKADSQRISERIEEKKLTLAQLEVQRQLFLSEKSKLQSMLNQKNSTLNELGTQVDRLKVANSRIEAQTLAEQNKKIELSRKLDEYSKEIKELNGNRSLSVAAQKERNEKLRKKIRELMEASLDSN